MLMLTAAGTVRDRVEGLGLGADDYLPKPFDFAELVARTRALARRSAPAVPPTLESGDIVLDPSRRVAFRAGRRLDLSPKEFAVLECLLAAAGRVVSAEELLERAGLACIHLRVAALFFENLELLHGEDIAGDGVIRNSFPDLAMNWMAGEDAGKLAIAALRFPERFGEKTAVYPTGTEKFTHSEVAGIIGRHLGRPLRHETISPEAWQKRLMELSEHDGRINLDMARHISAVGAGMRKPFPVNDMFRSVTQEQAMTLEAALKSGYLVFATRTAALSNARGK